MASIGHVAVGIAASRVYRRDTRPQWRSAALWSALSFLPDADVIGFSFGVQYGDPWGHRGATHSLISAIALGVAIGLVARRFKRPAGRTALLASATLASHAILDTMTDGGLGCALFWPFDLTRYFAPWRPIPVSPIGLDFLSPYGATVTFAELILFSPLLLLSLRSRRSTLRPLTAGFLAALWLASLWLTVSTGPAREAIVGFALREDTAYGRGFSEEQFRAIAQGTPGRDVRRLLGDPLGENWFYPASSEPRQRAMDTAVASVAGCQAVGFESAVVASAFSPDACRRLGIGPGASPADVEQRLGAPVESCWRYSRSPRGAHYRERVVCFLNDRVEMVIRRWN